MVENIIFGTAGFSIKYEKSELLQMLEKYFSLAKSPIIDTATNYPINGDVDKFGLTLDVLQEFSLPVRSLYIKIGAATNKGTQETLLNYSYLEFITSNLITRFSSAILGFGIHWDKRNHQSSIEETLGFLLELNQGGFTVGFSGIDNVSIYRNFFHEREIKYISQIRVDKLESSVIKSKFETVWCYGVKGGITKRKVDEVNCKELIQRVGVNHLIIGPSSTLQLSNSWEEYHQRS